ncbi:MAG: hypothetical protein R3B81_01825 [bacterium]
MRYERLRGPIILASVAALTLAAAYPGFAQVRGPNRTPGPPIGEIRSTWLFPYVRSVTEGISGSDEGEEVCCRVGKTTLRWYARDGSILHEVTGVATWLKVWGDSQEIFGKFPYYEMDSPHRESVAPAFLDTSRSGAVVLAGYYPDSHSVSLDLYRLGHLSRTCGPYEVTCPRNPALGVQDSGAFSVTIPGCAGDSARVILVDPGGEVTAHLLVANPRGVAVDPLGRGAVIERSGQDGTIWMAPGLDPVALDLPSGSAHVLCWAGDGALFHERSSDGSPFLVLIDLATGRQSWRVADAARADRLNDLAVAAGDWIYLYELELTSGTEQVSGAHKISVRSVASGEVVYVWRGQAEAPPPRAGRILEVAGEIYFLTDSEFARVDPMDVETEAHGWKRAGWDSTSGGP